MRSAGPTAEVLAIETEVPVHSLGTNDPLRAQQWPLDQTSFESTWPTTDGAGVIVAVVDTGVRGDHEDLAGVVLPGLDLVGNSDGRVDPNGHGTHVAGVIAASTGNGRGVAGAAPGVRILPVRVLAADGSGQSSDVAAGVVWAVQHGARVVNLSLGGTIPSEGMLDAITYADANGVLVVAAGGNGGAGANEPIYPAAYEPAVAVAAVDANRVRASFSSSGTYIDVAAPGVGVVSTYNSAVNAYASSSGTSMAAPYASAAAALVVAANPAADAPRTRAHCSSRVRTTSGRPARIRSTAPVSSIRGCRPTGRAPRSTAARRRAIASSAGTGGCSRSGPQPTAAISRGEC